MSDAPDALAPPHRRIRPPANPLSHASRERRRERQRERIGARANYVVVGKAYRRREAALGYLMILPAFTFFGVFSFYPMIHNFYLTQINTLAYPNAWVGMSQIWGVLTSSTFLQSLQSTAIYVAIIVPGGVFCGLFLAALANQKMRGIAIFRTAFASTITSSLAVGAAVFTIFFNPSYGFLPWIHFNIEPGITDNPTWALPAVALIQVWQFTGIAFIINIAGMQSLSDEVLEAASVDGASAFRRFWRVTIPMMTTTIYVTILLATIGALQGFGQIDVLIGANSSAYDHTNVLVYLVYQAVSVLGNYGLAACYSTVLFVITLVVTVFQMKLRSRGALRGL